MANVYSNDTGVAPQGVSINDSRRIFNFGERVSELAPQQMSLIHSSGNVGTLLLRQTERQLHWVLQLLTMSYVITTNLAMTSPLVVVQKQPHLSTYLLVK